jgi:hypothetical protein
VLLLAMAWRVDSVSSLFLHSAGYAQSGCSELLLSVVQLDLPNFAFGKPKD